MFALTVVAEQCRQGQAYEPGVQAVQAVQVAALMGGLIDQQQFERDLTCGFISAQCAQGAAEPLKRQQADQRLTDLRAALPPQAVE